MPSPPRIAVDLRALVPEATGIGVYTRGMLRALAARGEGEYLGLAHRPPQGAEEVAAAGVEIEPCEGTGSRWPLGVLWQQVELPRRLSRGDLDLFWSPLGTLPLASPLPAVVTVHDLTVLLFPETHRAKVRWSVLPFLSRSLERAGRIVADSRSTADDLAFHFPEHRDRVRVVHPGVDRAFEPGDAEEVAAIRAELGAPGGYLLYVGTLEPRKGVGTLLEAWMGLAAALDEPPPLLLAGGTGWHSGRLRRRLAALAPRVRHLGRVPPDELPRLYRGALALVYPSWYEGFGLPPLEAMASGVPVVTSDRSSLPEVVGEAGLLVPPGSPRELAHTLERLLAEPELRRELGHRGHERAGRFRWERSAGELAEVFREALGETAVRP